MSVGTEIEFASIEEALEDVAAGRMIVVVDDEDPAHAIAPVELGSAPDSAAPSPAAPATTGRLGSGAPARGNESTMVRPPPGVSSGPPSPEKTPFFFPQTFKSQK